MHPKTDSNPKIERKRLSEPNLNDFGVPKSQSFSGVYFGSTDSRLRASGHLDPYVHRNYSDKFQYSQFRGGKYVSPLG